MNISKRTLILNAVLFAHSTSSFAGGSGTDDIFGTWSAITLQGDLKAVSPNLDKVKWLVMNQMRTRNGSAQGT